MNHRQGGGKALGRASGIDNVCEGGGGHRRLVPVEQLRGERQERELVGVTAEELYVEAVQVQDLRDEEAEFTVAEHRDASSAGEANLLEDLTGGRNGLGEDSVLIGDR